MRRRRRRNYTPSSAAKLVILAKRHGSTVLTWRESLAKLAQPFATVEWAIANLNAGGFVKGWPNLCRAARMSMPRARKAG